MLHPIGASRLRALATTDPSCHHGAVASPFATTMGEMVCGRAGGVPGARRHRSNFHLTM